MTIRVNSRSVPHWLTELALRFEYAPTLREVEEDFDRCAHEVDSIISFEPLSIALRLRRRLVNKDYVPGSLSGLSIFLNDVPLRLAAKRGVISKEPLIEEYEAVLTVDNLRNRARILQWIEEVRSEAGDGKAN